jgi:hypothetical protein
MEIVRRPITTMELLRLVNLRSPPHSNDKMRIFTSAPTIHMMLRGQCKFSDCNTVSGYFVKEVCNSYFRFVEVDFSFY